MALLVVDDPGPVNWHPLIPAADRLPAEKFNVIAVTFVPVNFRFVAPAVGHTNLAGLLLVVMSIPVVELDV
jgi:hypothetical protein